MLASSADDRDGKTAGQTGDLEDHALTLTETADDLNRAVVTATDLDLPVSDFVVLDHEHLGQIGGGDGGGR